jgi:hypothetical protein
MDSADVVFIIFLVFMGLVVVGVIWAAYMEWVRFTDKGCVFNKPTNMSHDEFYTVNSWVCPITNSTK